MFLPPDMVNSNLGSSGFSPPATITPPYRIYANQITFPGCMADSYPTSITGSSAFIIRPTSSHTSPRSRMAAINSSLRSFAIEINRPPDVCGSERSRRSTSETDSFRIRSGRTNFKFFVHHLNKNRSFQRSPLLRPEQESFQVQPDTCI